MQERVSKIWRPIAAAIAAVAGLFVRAGVFAVHTTAAAVRGAGRAIRGGARAVRRAGGFAVGSGARALRAGATAARRVALAVRRTVARAARAARGVVLAVRRTVARAIRRVALAVRRTVARAARGVALAVRRAVARAARGVALAVRLAGALAVRAGAPVLRAVAAAVRAAARLLRRAGALAVEVGAPAVRAGARAVRAAPGARRLRPPRLQPRTRRRIAVLTISFVAAVVASAYNEGSIAGFPPHKQAGNLQIADSVTHIQVDLPAVGVVNRRAEPADMNGLIQRTDYVGRLIVTPPVLDEIARRAGVPEDQIGGLVRMTGDVPLALTEPDSERRASDIAESFKPYRLEVQSRPTTPIVDVFVQAPTLEAANRIADASVMAVDTWMRNLAGRQGLAQDSIPALRQLGQARGGVVNHKAPIVIGGLTFVTVFGLVAAALFGLIRLLVPDPRRSAAPREEPVLTDNWPHTGRTFPWMLAVFVAVVYVTPFSAIQLNMSLPIDLKLDRLILPFVIIPWLLSMAAGGPSAPRLRVTRIHVAVGVFVALAFLSVTLDARYLNNTQELMLSLKQLPLLVTYVSLFLMASTLRRAEVSSFLNLMLALAVICSLGMIIEYRFKTNLFYSWSDKLLPSFFTVSGILPGGAVDELGRRLVRGPAEVSLEAVTMLAVALPIALVGLLHTKRVRARLYYSFAAAILLAAMVATYRKSGLLAPVAIVLTLAYFRRRELLKLAPLGMIVFLMISVLSPGAMGSVVSQFTRSDRSQVSTVSDRASDYDAVRPDVFSHIAFGRGWGSYNHQSYRILDSEILHRVLEVGVLGLISFLMVMVSVVLATRKTIDLRHPRWSPPALVTAAAAIAFIVVAMLYDVLSFPHGTYAFLFLAGLACVVSDVPAEPARRLRQSAESRMRPARRPAGTRGSAEPARRVRSAPAHAPAAAPRSAD